MVSADEEEMLNIVPQVQTKHAISKKRSHSGKRRKSESEDDTVVIIGVQGDIYKVPKEFLFYTKTKPSLSFSRDKVQSLVAKVSKKNENEPLDTPSMIPPENDAGVLETASDQIPAENGDSIISKKHKKSSKKKKKSSSELSKEKRKRHKHKSNKGKKEKGVKQKKKKEKHKHKKKDKKAKTSEHKKKRKRETDQNEEEPVEAKVRKIEAVSLKERKKKSKKHKKEKSRSRSRSILGSTRTDSKQSGMDDNDINNPEAEELDANGHESPKWNERVLSCTSRNSFSEHEQDILPDEMNYPSEREVTVKAQVPFLSEEKSNGVNDASDQHRDTAYQSNIASDRMVRIGGISDQSKPKSSEVQYLSEALAIKPKELDPVECELDTEIVPDSNSIVNSSVATDNVVSESLEKYDPFEHEFDDSPVYMMKKLDSPVSEMTHNIDKSSFLEVSSQEDGSCDSSQRVNMLSAVGKGSSDQSLSGSLKKDCSSVSGDSSLSKTLKEPEKVDFKADKTVFLTDSKDDHAKNGKIGDSVRVPTPVEDRWQAEEKKMLGRKVVPISEFFAVPEPRNTKDFLSADFSSDLDLDSFEFFRPGEVVLTKPAVQHTFKVKPRELADLLPNGLRHPPMSMDKANRQPVVPSGEHAAVPMQTLIPQMDKGHASIVGQESKGEVTKMSSSLPLKANEEISTGISSPDSVYVNRGVIIPSPMEIPLPDLDTNLPPLPPEPQSTRGSLFSIPTPESNLKTLLPSVPLPSPAVSIPMPVSAPPRLRGHARPAKAPSVMPPWPVAIIPPPRPRHIAPLPSTVAVSRSALLEKSGTEQDHASKNCQATSLAIPVPAPTAITSSAAELEKEPVKIKFALKILPSRFSRVLKYSAANDEETKDDANDSAAGDSDGRTSSLEQSDKLECSPHQEEADSQKMGSNIEMKSESQLQKKSMADDSKTCLKMESSVRSSDEGQSDSTVVSEATKEMPVGLPLQDSLRADKDLSSEPLWNLAGDHTPILSHVTESSSSKAKTVRGQGRSRSRSPRKRSRSPRRSRSRSPRRRSPKRSRRSSPRSRKRSPRRSVSPRRSPAKVSPTRRSSPQPLSPKRSPVRRSSPRRFSPRRSPLRSSPVRRSPRRSSPRFSPCRRSPRRSPARGSSPRRSPRRSSPRSSPRRSPRRYRSPRRSPRRRSPRSFRRTSPKRTPPREYSPRLTPRDSPCTRSPLPSEQSQRRWSPKRILADTSPLIPHQAISHCSPCFSPGITPVPPSAISYQPIPVLRQVPIFDESNDDQTPFTIQTITSHIERQEVQPRSRKQAIHETVLIHIEPCAIPLPEDGRTQDHPAISAPPKPENEEMEISSVSSDETEDYTTQRLSLDERLRTELETNDDESWSNSSLGGGWNLNSPYQFSSEGSELIRQYMDELERYYASLRDCGGYAELPPPVTLVRVGNTLRVIPYKPVNGSSQVPMKPAISKVRINGANSTKRVIFADNVRPGEGTSPSCGEEMSSPPLKRRRRRKKKTPSPPDDSIDDLRAELEDPPPPPPGSPSLEGTPAEEVGESPLLEKKQLSPFSLGLHNRESSLSAFESPQLPETQLTSEQILMNLNLFGDSNPY